MKKAAYSYQPNDKKYNGMHITSLHRYAVKGLSGDSVPLIKLNDGDGTFEDDRRFALMYDTRDDTNGVDALFDDKDPSWLHKENFLCAFTAPELLATLDTEYRIETSKKSNDDDAKRLLTIWDRKLGRSCTPLLGPIDLACSVGRDEVSHFFTELCGKKVRCVVANADPSATKEGQVTKSFSNRHTHQFGNTSSGVKNNKGDTRTIHIINENTVKQFSEAVHGVDTSNNKDNYCLSGTRFRPNIIVNNLEPWAEFDLIGKVIEVVPKNNIDIQDPPLRFRITSRTVRCVGVGVDPLNPDHGAIDIPKLLTKHFPEHGPYLGVYAVVDNEEGGASCGGTICVGDTFRVMDA
eukprot:CAMPEP_0172304598 /NCGR_PEP_ID=MMETSP1058-20130122/5993_1 /TAXON_ID=83371 /ORGANISM="Detonula confervacea, Strain CCMP 353" /LENGTH=349 /DNA_ID=CAMNT_0013015897 /DNA_START=147 /DNA_END=1196 /DNA_ORIENTATION=-